MEVTLNMGRPVVRKQQYSQPAPRAFIAIALFRPRVQSSSIKHVRALL